MALYIDDSALPLVLITTDSEVRLPDINAYLRDLDALLTKRQPFVTIVSVKRLIKFDRVVIQMMVDWFKKNNEVVSQLWLGLVLLSPSAIVSFALSSMSLLLRFPMPKITVRSYEEGIVWAEDILQKNRLSLPKVASPQWHSRQ